MSPPDGERGEPAPHDLHERMFQAAEEGDESTLQKLLAEWERRGLDREIVDGSLYGAVAADRVGCVRQLMGYGAWPDEDAITRAAEVCVSVDVWQAFLDHGWDVNSSNDIGDLSVIFDPSIDPRLTWFLSHGASLEARSWRTGLTVLSYAAKHSSLPVLRTLVPYAAESGRDILASSNALHAAAANAQEDRSAAMALLVDELGADVNALSAFGKRMSRYNRSEARPLHYAVESGRREHVRFLLDRNARVTELDEDGRDVRARAKYVGREDGLKAVEEWFAENGLEMPGEGAGVEGEKREEGKGATEAEEAKQSL